MGKGFAYTLRMMSPCENEHKETALTVTDIPAAFTSQLSGNNKRKALVAYNNSADSSGELYFGHDANVNEHTGRPIPKDDDVDIPIGGTALDIYFVAASGEKGDLRLFECS